MNDEPPPLTSSRLGDELKQRQQASIGVFGLLSQAYIDQRQQQPQLWKAWRRFKPEEQFDMFVSAFRGGIANSTILHLLQQAIEAGKFNADDLDDIVAGRKKIVDVE